MKKVPIWQGIVVFDEIIYGEPIAQPRPRVTVRGKFPHAYTPAKHPVNNWRDTLRLRAQEWARNGGKMICRPHAVWMHVIFYFQPPKGFKISENIDHTKKPDLDNLIKAVTDSLNQIVFEDDSQISQCWTEKNYTCDGQPRVEILITGDLQDGDVR